MTVGPQLRVIPVWMRVLAGVLVAAAGLAIVLLIRSAPVRVVDGMGFVRVAGEAVFYLCTFVLCTYVAATGLPPSHLWPGAGRPFWPARTELPATPELHRFLSRLRDRHPGIRECWLLESAVQGEWRLLALADGAVLDAVRSDWDIRRKDVHLYLLEDDSGAVALAWGRPSPEAFSTWNWEPQGDMLAEFQCPVAAEVRIAQCLWSR